MNNVFSKDDEYNLNSRYNNSNLSFVVFLMRRSEHLLKKFRFYSKISKDYLWIIWSLYLVLLFVYYFVLVHFLWKTLKNINNWTILDNKNLINILFILYLLFPIISYWIISIASILFTWILYEIIKFWMIKKVEKDKLEEESKLTI